MWELSQFIIAKRTIQRCIFYFKRLNLWELSQITILRINSKIVGTHTFRKFFLVRQTHVKEFFFEIFKRISPIIIVFVIQRKLLDEM